MPTLEVRVHVPEDRLTEFYSRFGDFMIEQRTAQPSANAMHAVGTAPDWVHEAGAKERAARFWHQITDVGRDLLRVLVAGAEAGDGHQFTPAELVSKTSAKSAQSVAGTFGGVGQLIASEGLPSYTYAAGKQWHFIWDWDPKKRLYSMSPDMAKLLREVGA
jgi:hypothetical protein